MCKYLPPYRLLQVKKKSLLRPRRSRSRPMPVVPEAPHSRAAPTCHSQFKRELFLVLEKSLATRPLTPRSSVCVPVPGAHEAAPRRLGPAVIHILLRLKPNATQIAVVHCVQNKSLFVTFIRSSGVSDAVFTFPRLTPPDTPGRPHGRSNEWCSWAPPHSTAPSTGRSTPRC